MATPTDIFSQKDCCSMCKEVFNDMTPTFDEGRIRPNVCGMCTISAKAYISGIFPPDANGCMADWSNALPSDLFDSDEEQSSDESEDEAEVVELDGAPVEFNLRPIGVPPGPVAPLWRRRSDYAPDGRPLRPCCVHPDRVASVYCDNCLQSACAECTSGVHRGHSCLILADVVAGSREESRRYLSKASGNAALVQRKIQQLRCRAKEVGTAADTAIRKVQLLIGNLKDALEDRERELVDEVKKVRAMRQRIFDDRLAELERFAADLDNAEKTIYLGLEERTDVDLLRCRAEATRQDRRVRRLEWMPMPRRDAEFEFTADEGALIAQMASIGSIDTGGFGPNSIAAGRATRWALAQRDNTLVVRTADHQGRPLAVGGDDVKAVILAAGGEVAKARVVDRGDGSYTVTYRPEIDSKHWVYVAVRGVLVRDAPFEVAVNTVRDYGGVGEGLAAFGRPGSGDGELCRPWGVCCDARGRVIVADRSNDRVQVFDRHGRFLHKFGGTGHGPGQFYRPSGVAADNREDGGTRIIVVDKDNHRVQVFTFDGQLMFGFGARGHLPGQFHYPWDAAVNERTHEICITDSRNSRLQLFTQDGDFITAFTLDEGPAKALDSPRGVAYDRRGNFVVTDFNHHRLLLIDPCFRFVRFLAGKEILNRPQGIDVDQEGNVVVANSKNNEVCVFNPDGSLKHVFGTKGTMLGQFEKPTGLGISNDGLIYVVDFDNTRVQCF